MSIEMPGSNTLPHEIKVGSIFGIRGWELDKFFARPPVDDNELRLKSCLTIDGPWEPYQTRLAKVQKMLSSCNVCAGVSAPCIIGGTGNKCGIHAVQTLELFEELNVICSPKATILGIVTLFGRVVECSFGWRAEFAEVHMIAANHPKSVIIARNYGVPLIQTAELNDIVKTAQEGEPA